MSNSAPNSAIAVRPVMHDQHIGSFLILNYKPIGNRVRIHLQYINVNRGHLATRSVNINLENIARRDCVTTATVAEGDGCQACDRYEVGAYDHRLIDKQSGIPFRRHLRR